MASTTVLAAVRENAHWCDLVCRFHGRPTAFTDGVWRAGRRSPEFYPDAVTLTPGIPAERVLAGLDLSPGCSVKDSFADLDLAPYGFTVLFDAQWIHRPAWTGGPGGWRRIPPGDFPADPSVVVLGDGRGGRVVAHRSEGTAGLSNLTGDDWPGAVAAVGTAFPGLPIVGYEQAGDLPAAVAAGFTATGPLRVWLRPH
jgi:hypothetical protein